MNDQKLGPGIVLNHTYEIVELVGEGGTGEVYLARNQATGREVAIKRLKKEFATDPLLVDLMQREANALHEIMHNAVVRYYELLRTDMEGGFTFLVMEFIRGESLEKRMRQGPVPADELMHIARRVVDGLEAAHAGKVLHRDLTPANIILRDGDPTRATLIDFGIAKDLGQTDKTVLGGGFAGTYRYASPEQINSQPLDNRSDFYSLGASLLAAAEGDARGSEKTLQEIMAAKAVLPELDRVPAAVRPLIEALMQPSKEARPANADAIRVFIDGTGQVDDLDALIDGPPAGAMPDRTVVQPRAAATPAQPKADEKKGGGAIAWVLGLGVAAGLAAAAYFVVPGLLEEPLPVAAPYELDFIAETDRTVISGHAPDQETADRIAAALADAGGSAVHGSLSLAQGLPSESWEPGAIALANAGKPLGTWRVSIDGTRAAITGEAATPDAFASVESKAQLAAETGGFELDFRVSLAPQPLTHAALLGAVAPFTKCGPLSFEGPDPLPPGQPVAISGPVASQDDADALRRSVQDLDPVRDISLDLTVASELVCRVERLLPGANAPELDFVFSYGQKEGSLVNAAYVANENPVVDVMVAESHEADFLYVFYVDGNTRKVIHLLPYKDRPQNKVNLAGVKEKDEYRVRILFPAGDVKVGQRGFLVGPPYGTNILVAVASPRAFLEEMLPRNDTADLFLEDLVDALSRAETTNYVVSREFFTTAEN